MKRKQILMAISLALCIAAGGLLIMSALLREPTAQEAAAQAERTSIRACAEEFLNSLQSAGYQNNSLNRSMVDGRAISVAKLPEFCEWLTQYVANHPMNFITRYGQLPPVLPSVCFLSPAPQPPPPSPQGK